MEENKESIELKGDGDVMEQPGEALQQLLNAIYDAKPEEVMFLGSKRKVGWITNGTQRKFSDITLTEKNVHKANCKVAAVILLNNIWKIRLFYWLLWRWYYYVKDINVTEVLRLVDAAKKKVPHDAYLLVTMYSTEMTDVMMTMTKKEVSRSRAVQAGVPRSV